MIIISRFQPGKNGKHRIRIERPIIQNSEEELLWRAVHHYAQLIPFEPDPNMGRVREIKEEIRRGTYFKPEMIDETAARLTIRLTRSESST